MPSGSSRSTAAAGGGPPDRQDLLPQGQGPLRPLRGPGHGGYPSPEGRKALPASRRAEGHRGEERGGEPEAGGALPGEDDRLHREGAFGAVDRYRIEKRRGAGRASLPGGSAVTHTS